MWVTKLLIYEVKKRIFGQFGPGHAGLFNALLWVGWWMWRAGCISQDTYLLYNSCTVKHPLIPTYPVLCIQAPLNYTYKPWQQY